MKKTNRTFKRFAAITSASLLAACAMAPLATSICSYAVDITVGGESDAERTFVAYKILDASVSEDNKNITYSVNSNYKAALISALDLSNDATDTNIINAITALKDNATGMRTFADKLYAAVKNGTPDVEEFNGGTATDVETGYYLIVDTSDGLEDDVRSKVMVDTADNREGGLKVNLKKEGPTFEKFIWDTDDSKTALPADNVELKEYTGWSESADHDMGDKVPFKLEATLPSDIALYDNYKIIFNDTLGSGFTRNNDVKVYFGEEDVTSLFTVSEVDANGKFTISDNTGNIKDNEWTFASSNVITVYYTANLDTDAEIGDPGNWNQANLTYTNDYYWDGVGGSDNDSTTNTTDEYVVAFTYKTIIDKIDSDYKALTGAGFTLYKKVMGESTAAWEKVGSEVTGVTKFEFSGLDAGEYKLVESTVPDGYTKADDIEFTIAASHKETGDAYAESGILDTFTVTGGLNASKSDGMVVVKKDETNYTVNSGEIYGEVINKSGTLLPGTGGIGTTIFYLGGGAMAAIGGVYLISKRRMKKSEE